MTMNGFGRAAGWCARWSLVLLMAVGCGSASGLPGGKAGADLDERTGADLSEEAAAANPFVFRVDSEPYGISMKEWAYNWLRWEYSIPAATNPIIVPGADYDQHQVGPVYFVPDGPNHNDAFSVPRHKALAIMLSHVLPNVMGPVLVIATIHIATAIITEATLSFLGVGVPATRPSLGTLIRIGNEFLYSGEWWITVFPGVALVTLVLSVNLLGDWLRDALNPKLR